MPRIHHSPEEIRKLLSETTSVLRSAPSGPHSAGLAPSHARKTSRLPTGAEAADVGEIQRLGRRALPPFPGTDVVKPATIPGPPLLRSSAGPEERARFLGAAFRGAIESRYQVRSFAFVHKEPTTWADFGLLTDAADRLEALEVPPAAWVLFSIDSWRDQHPGIGPPRPSWVYSLKRMQERIRWFFESKSYEGGQLIFAPEHLTLTQAYWVFWREMLAKRPTTRGEVLAVIESHFPGDTFERAVQKAAAATARLQIEIDTAVSEGVVLW